MFVFDNWFKDWVNTVDKNFSHITSNIIAVMAIITYCDFIIVHYYHFLSKYTLIGILQKIIYILKIKKNRGRDAPDVY